MASKRAKSPSPFARSSESAARDAASRVMTTSPLWRVPPPFSPAENEARTAASFPSRVTASSVRRASLVAARSDLVLDGGPACPPPVLSTCQEANADLHATGFSGSHLVRTGITTTSHGLAGVSRENRGAFPHLATRAQLYHQKTAKKGDTGEGQTQSRRRKCMLGLRTRHSSGKPPHRHLGTYLPTTYPNMGTYHPNKVGGVPHGGPMVTTLTSMCRY
jgi:hypothetical protein